MKLLVTGGTGFVGRPLVRALLAAGHQVTVLTRDVRRAGEVLPVRCAIRAWKPAADLDPSGLRGADALVHLAGEGVADGRWTPARKHAIRDSRVRISRALVRALSALPAHERPTVLVSASAIGYYGDRGTEALDEDASAGSGFLAEVCEAWEREILSASGLGVRTAVIRIGVVLGRDGGALARMLPPFRLGLGGRVGTGRQWMSWIDVRDLVDMFVFALERADVSGPLNGVAPNPVTNADFTAVLGRALGRPTILPVPACALRAVLGEMSTVLLASQRALPEAAQRLGFAFRYPTLSGALTDLCADLSHELESEQWLGHSPEVVFSFFADAHNLERITPEFLRFRVLGMTTPELTSGTVINYRLSLHGLPIRWQSRIESWEPNQRFVDRQTRGPYRLWHHTHEFEPHDGGTIIRDRVRYVLPWGPLGDAVAGWLVARDLKQIFAFRRTSIGEAFARSTEA